MRGSLGRATKRWWFPDVAEFPRDTSRAVPRVRSELVLPVQGCEQGRRACAVFDVDSTAEVGDFDQQDDADRLQRLIDAVGSWFIDNATSPPV